MTDEPILNISMKMEISTIFQGQFCEKLIEETERTIETWRKDILKITMEAVFRSPESFGIKPRQMSYSYPVYTKKGERREWRTIDRFPTEKWGGRPIVKFVPMRAGVHKMYTPSKVEFTEKEGMLIAKGRTYKAGFTRAESPGTERWTKETLRRTGRMREAALKDCTDTQLEWDEPPPFYQWGNDVMLSDGFFFLSFPWDNLVALQNPKDGKNYFFFVHNGTVHLVARPFIHKTLNAPGVKESLWNEIRDIALKNAVWRATQDFTPVTVFFR